MIRALTRRALAALTLAVLGTSTAQTTSGCTAMYALTNDNTPQVRVVFPNRSTALVSNLTGNVNGAALHPVTGEMYYVDRTNQTAPVLRKFNPNSRTDTVVGVLSEPTNVNTTYNLNIGATFDNSVSPARLYLLYGTYQIVEVNPDTAATRRTIQVNYPTTDSTGANVVKRNESGPVLTSGDFVFTPDGTAYAALDGLRGKGGSQAEVVYHVTLGKLSDTTTSQNLTVAAPVPIRRSDGTYVGGGNVNGTAYDPINGTIYVTYVDSDVAGATGGSSISQLSLPGAQLTPRTGNASYSDLSDCAVMPAAPSIEKTFSSVKQLTNTVITLTIKIGNANPTPYYTQDPITDPLPGTMRVAATPAASTTCTTSAGGAAPLIASAGATSVQIPANIRIPAGGCQYTLQVTSPSAGLLTNVITAADIVTTSGTPTADAVYATRFQNALIGAGGSSAATITKTQALCTTTGGVTTCGTPVATALNAKPGDRVEYCLIAKHPGINWADATRTVLRDQLNNNLIIDPNAYGPGRGVKLTRTTTPGTTSYISIGSVQTTGGAWRQGITSPYDLRIDAAPFTEGTTVTACFQVTIR